MTRRRRRKNHASSVGEGASLFMELFDIITDVIRLVWRLPALLLRIFD